MANITPVVLDRKLVIDDRSTAKEESLSHPQNAT